MRLRSCLVRMSYAIIIALSLFLLSPRGRWAHDGHQQSLPALFPSLSILLNPEAWETTANRAKLACNLSPDCPWGLSQVQIQTRPSHFARSMFRAQFLCLKLGSLA